MYNRTKTNTFNVGRFIFEKNRLVTGEFNMFVTISQNTFLLKPKQGLKLLNLLFLITLLL